MLLFRICDIGKKRGYKNDRRDIDSGYTRTKGTWSNDFMPQSTHAFLDGEWI